jgi:ABC-type uncharacterized transport system involved in gliding motility auxiliary subunit
MASRMGKGGTATGTAVGIILVAAILVLVNVIAEGNFVRLDLTADKEFTISDATKEIMRDLDDLVTITVYMSETLPTQLSTLRRQISDTLDEYRSYGRGRVQVEFVDPAKDPEIEQRMRSLGIPQITAQTLEKDQFQSINIYLGVLISYLDRQEVIPLVQDTYTLEYDLTSAILKVASERTYKVGVLSEHVQHALSTHLTGVRELLQGQFTVVPVTLADGEREVPPDVDLLIVPGPRNVPDRVEYQIDQYLMRGGKIIFLMDAIELDASGGLQATAIQSGIEDLLAHYGVRVQNGLIIDPDRTANATASFSSGYVRYTLPYPYWVKAVPDLLNAQHPITNRLESIVLPWCAPIEVDVEIAPGDPLGHMEELLEQQREAQRQLAKQLGVELADEGDDDTAEDAGSEAGPLPSGGAAAGSVGAELRAHVLARTSPQSWTVSGFYDLNPQQRFVPAGGKVSSKITAVALSGTFTSLYNEAPIPATPDGGEAGGPADTAAVGDDGAEGAILSGGDDPLSTLPPLRQSPETQIIVVGNAQFATDQFLGQFNANSVFLQNVVDYLTLGDQLISIRSRGATDRPLKHVSDGAKSTIKIAGILGTPVLVILYGLVRFGIRRKRMAVREMASSHRG